MTGLKAIYQLLPTLVAGDAIGDNALMLHRLWQKSGIEARLYAVSSTLGRNVRPPNYLPMQLTDREALVYHHSTGSQAATYFSAASGGTRILVYHNITPPELLSHAPAIAACSHWGLEQLDDLAGHYDFAVADSRYNASQLAGAFNNTAIIPLVPDQERTALLRAAAEKRVLSWPRLEREPTFLFVGRLIPHKRIEDVIKIFRTYQRSFSMAAKLKIVGPATEAPAYVSQLHEMIRQGNVRNVEFTGKLLGEDLANAYAAADMYLCTSRHEGFCLPLVEAMLAEVPVLTTNVGGIPDTVGTAALMFEGADIPGFVEAAHLLLTDQEARAKVIAAQMVQCQRFTRQVVERCWTDLLAQAEEAST